MLWSELIPTTEGQHVWRESAGARIHPVRAKLRKGKIELHCKTMDIRRVMVGGQWRKKEDTSDANPSV